MPLLSPQTLKKMMMIILAYNTIKNGFSTWSYANSFPHGQFLLSSSQLSNNLSTFLKKMFLMDIILTSSPSPVHLSSSPKDFNPTPMVPLTHPTSIMWVKVMVYLQSGTLCSSKSQIIQFVATQIEPEGILLSKISQNKRVRYRIIFLLFST